jgi:ribosomal protein L40E
MMWANQSTRQVKTYIRMSQDEQDRVMLRHHGIITDEESQRQERRVNGVICPTCHTVNPPTARYCHICASPLTKETQEQLDMVTQMIRQSPEYRRLEQLQRDYEAAAREILQQQNP